AAQLGKDKVVIADAGSGLAGFGDWAEQLIAESTGKHGRGLLPVVVEAPDAPGWADAGDDALLVLLGRAEGRSLTPSWEVVPGAASRRRVSRPPRRLPPACPYLIRRWQSPPPRHHLALAGLPMCGCTAASVRSSSSGSTPRPLQVGSSASTRSTSRTWRSQRRTQPRSSATPGVVRCLQA